MPSTIDWPTSLPFAAYRLDLVSRTRTGGVAISGVEQVLSPLASVWQLSATVNLGSAESVRTFRAFRAGVQGRLNRVKFQLDQIAETHATAAALANSPAPVTASGAVGDVTLSVNKGSTGLLAGHWVTIKDRLYEVVSDATGTIDVYPALRDAITTSDVVYTAPHFIGRAVDDATYTLPIGPAGHASLNLQFVEAFDLT